MRKQNTISWLLALIMTICSVSMPFSAYAKPQYYESYFQNNCPEAYSAILPDNCIDLSAATVDGDAFLARYVPQGIAAYGEYFLVSGYEKDEAIKQTIVIFDKHGVQKGAIILNIDSHMGGITFANGYIWIASTTRVLSFPSSFVDEAIQNGQSTVKESDTTKSFELNIKEMKKKKSLWERVKMFFIGLFKKNNRFNRSFCTCYNGILWVGSYSKVVSGELFALQMNDDGEAIDTGVMIDIPKRVQGVEFYNDGSKEYIVMAGRQCISSYLFNQNSDAISDKGRLQCLKMTSYIEEGMIDLSTGIYYQVFESGSAKFSSKESTVVVDKVLAMNVSSILPVAQPQPQTTAPAAQAAETTTEVDETTAEATTAAKKDYTQAAKELIYNFPKYGYDHSGEYSSNIEIIDLDGDDIPEILFSMNWRANPLIGGVYYFDGEQYVPIEYDVENGTMYPIYPVKDSENQVRYYSNNFQTKADAMDSLEFVAGGGAAYYIAYTSYSLSYTFSNHQLKNEIIVDLRDYVNQVEMGDDSAIDDYLAALEKFNTRFETDTSKKYIDVKFSTDSLSGVDDREELLQIYHQLMPESTVEDILKQYHNGVHYYDLLGF